jgi:hypothetical protein
MTYIHENPPARVPPVVIGGFLLSGAFMVEGAGVLQLGILSLVLGGLYCAGALHFCRRADNGSIQRTPLLPLFLQQLLLAFFVVWALRVVSDYRVLGLQGLGIRMAASYFTMLFICLLLIRSRYFLNAKEQLLAVIVAISVYALANIVADFAGVGPDRSHENMDRLISRFEFAEYRWLPPLAISNGAFGMLVGMGMALLIKYVNLASKEERLRLAGLLAGLCAILLYALVKAQFRASLLVLMCALAWLLLSARGKALFDSLLVVAFPMTALAFIDLYASDLLEVTAPSWLWEISGSRTPEQFYTLSGRAYIYEYGFEVLNSFKVAVFGAGPGLRDASPAGYDTQIAEVGLNLGFHHSFLDLWIAHGIAGPILIIGCMLLVALRTLRLARVGQSSVDDFASLAPIGTVAAASLFDGALSYLPLAMLMFLPACTRARDS